MTEQDQEMESIRSRVLRLLCQYDRPMQELSARCDNVTMFFSTGIYHNLEHRTKRLLDFLNIIAMLSEDIRVGDIENLPEGGLERFEETINLHREHILRVIDWDNDLFDAWLGFNGIIEWGEDDFIITIRNEEEWKDAHQGVLDYIFGDQEGVQRRFINPKQPFASKELVKEFMEVFDIK